ncbi:hypothetical protein NNC19_12790 [Clostridium sp. SHJSY1]|uniref:hypothetical protein n=1 Tax=Clostridium sp. SHJSY1 TaxID=2942483 RepID=UPI002876FAE3|nr:hypothetical protein [Clostridium sp. SHJSY1]MDS0526561.1 hypothetical protein [Clostridium sp. SHJSY1]
MTIPNKNSRKIVIGNKTYRWTISPDDGYIVFVAEQDDFKGRRLEVYIDSDINKLWRSFPCVKELNLKIIKPKDAEVIISQAINKGWNPEEKGSPIIFDLKQDFLLISRKS